jgi:hypothetical protein
VGSALFLTGMQRSGTTLLEKLLAGHPQISVLSQPTPFVFLEAKRAFLRTIGAGDDPYPLGHLFGEDRYRPEDLASFLREWRIGGPWLREVFAAMEGYSGQYTRFPPEELEGFLDSLPEEGFAPTLAQLYRRFAHRNGAVLCGAKETICEEFLPYLLGQGWRCLVILRDPRDVLASLNHGRGEQHGGRPKPTLFNLRHWRKSVDFAFRLEGRPGFAWVRYEDLVERPLEILDALAARLGVTPFPPDLLEGEIRAQDGRAWAGNSSHAARQGVTAGSVGVHRGVLPAEVVRFTEAACHPEMRRLGYPLSIEEREIPGLLAGFQDPYAGARPDIPESDLQAALGAELRR